MQRKLGQYAYKKQSDQPEQLCKPHRLSAFRFFRSINIHRRRKRGGQGGGGAGARPPNNLRGGANIPFGPPNIPPICTGKTIPLKSILEFSIISDFNEKCNNLALIY